MTSQNLFFALLLLVFSLQTTLTAQAVQLVRDYIPGSTSSFDEDSETPLGIIKNQLIFTQRDNSDKLSLWATDGTAIGTKQIHQPLAFTDPVDFQLIDSFIYFKETFFGNTYLVRSGGTENSKISISIASSDQELLSFLPIKDTIFYLVKYSSGGIQLRYHKISTASGNFIYNDFNESFYQPLEMARLDEHRFVFLAGLQDGRYLFVSDGTYPGTKAIKNLNSGSEFAQAPYMTRVGNKVFFFYKMPITGGGYWLYVTDGTTQGTLALKEFEFVPFSDFRLTRSLLPLQDKFYFRAQPIGNGGNQEELWVSDGTVNGTFSLEPTPGKYTNPSYLTPYNNKLYFKGENFSGVNGLFSTNGSIGSTILEVNGSQIGSGLDLGVDYLTAFADSLAFLGFRSETGGELVLSNGEDAGTRLIDIVPGNTSSLPKHLFASDSILFFLAQTPETGRELFIYDPYDRIVSTGSTPANFPNLELFPNPASTAFSLRYPADAGTLKLIRLCDPSGRVVKEWHNPQSIIEYAISGIANGTYWICVYTENGFSFKQLQVQN